MLYTLGFLVRKTKYSFVYWLYPGILTDHCREPLKLHFKVRGKRRLFNFIHFVGPLISWMSLLMAHGHLYGGGYTEFSLLNLLLVLEPQRHFFLFFFFLCYFLPTFPPIFLSFIHSFFLVSLHFNILLIFIHSIFCFPPCQPLSTLKFFHTTYLLTSLCLHGDVLTPHLTWLLMSLGPPLSWG